MSCFPKWPLELQRFSKVKCVMADVGWGGRYGPGDGGKQPQGLWCSWKAGSGALGASGSVWGPNNIHIHLITVSRKAEMGGHKYVNHVGASLNSHHNFPTIMGRLHCCCAARTTCKPLPTFLRGRYTLSISQWGHNAQWKSLSFLFFSPNYQLVSS